MRWNGREVHGPWVDVYYKTVARERTEAEMNAIYENATRRAEEYYHRPPSKEEIIWKRTQGN